MRLRLDSKNPHKALIDPSAASLELTAISYWSWFRSPTGLAVLHAAVVPAESVPAATALRLWCSKGSDGVSSRSLEGHRIAGRGVADLATEPAVSAVVLASGSPASLAVYVYLEHVAAKGGVVVADPPKT